MRMASTNAGKFKNLDVEMQKTPVNRGVPSLLNGSKQVQNGMIVTLPIVTGFISDDFPVIGIQEIAKASRAGRPREPWTADESPEAASTDTSAGEGPDFANSSRFHSAPFQRRPANRPTGPRFHSTPLHRLELSKIGSPGDVSAKAFAKSPQPARRASGPCRNFRTHHAPKISPPSADQASPWPLRFNLELVGNSIDYRHCVHGASEA